MRPTQDSLEVLTVARHCNARGGAQNPYGHAAIRYSFRSEDGKGYEQYVMNVVGLATHPLINFLSPEDYLYGSVTPAPSKRDVVAVKLIHPPPWLCGCR